MSTVEVHNLNVHEFKMKFREELITIPPKGFVEMEYDDAVLFRGTMPPKLDRDADGNILPTSYQMLRIVQDGSGKRSLHEAKAREAELKCLACGFIAIDKQDLHIHTKENHIGTMENKEAAAKLSKKK